LTELFADAEEFARERMHPDHEEFVV
jgi:hypothetical protein